MESLRGEHQEFRARVVSAQGPLLQSFLYKLTRSAALEEFLNSCGDVINPLATTDSIDLISLDHPDLDIKKPEYSYDKDVRKQVNWRLAERILKATDFPLLNSLKDVDHLLTPKEVLKLVVDENLMFRESDEAGIVSLLGPPMLVSRRDPSPTPQVPAVQPPQGSELPALQDLPNTEDVV